MASPGGSTSSAAWPRASPSACSALPCATSNVTASCGGPCMRPSRHRWSTPSPTGAQPPHDPVQLVDWTDGTWPASKPHERPTTQVVPPTGSFSSEYGAYPLGRCRRLTSPQRDRTRCTGPWLARRGLNGDEVDVDVSGLRQGRRSPGSEVRISSRHTWATTPHWSPARAASSAVRSFAAQSVAD